MAYTPLYGGTLDASFPLQFPQSNISNVSLAVVLIEQLSRDGLRTTVSHGTGFMWRDGGVDWLITARHVLTGRNPFDGAPLSGNLYEPQEIRVHLATGKRGVSADRIGRVISLFNDSTPAWAEDPEFPALRTDIAAIPLEMGETHVYCINDDTDFGKHDNLLTHVGFQCFVIGYPTTSVTGLMLPIWKSGSVASDPRAPIDEKPIFLVDAATGPGFSGSSVYRVQIGPAPFHDETVQTRIRIEADAVVRSSFVGVYAGRLHHPHVGAQTPYVFYGNRVPIMIAANRHRALIKPT